MPWHIETDNSECDDFAVVKDDDGAVEGCHETRNQAERQMAALYASEPDVKAADDAIEAKARYTVGRVGRVSSCGRAVFQGWQYNRVAWLVSPSCGGSPRSCHTCHTARTAARRGRNDVGSALCRW